MHVHTQEVAQQSVPAMAQADGLQPGKQAALLLIEQAIEEKDRRLEFMRRGLESGGMNRHGNGLSAAPGKQLFAAWNGLDGGIEKLVLDLHSGQTLLLNKMAQRLLHFGVQVIGQLVGVVAVGRLVDESFYRGQ